MKPAAGVVASHPIQIAFSDFKEITKARLAVSVVFSAVAGYFLGADEIHLSSLLLLTVGGYCMVGASNAFNQVIERDLDARMHRTKNRPIPSGRMSVHMAMGIAIFLTLAGILQLYLLNPKTALFGTLSIFLYTCVYTPLKTVTPLSVFAGAFPGADSFYVGLGGGHGGIWYRTRNPFYDPVFLAIPALLGTGMDAG